MFRCSYLRLQSCQSSNPEDLPGSGSGKILLVMMSGLVQRHGNRRGRLNRRLATVSGNEWHRLMVTGGQITLYVKAGYGLKIFLFWLTSLKHCLRKPPLDIRDAIINHSFNFLRWKLHKVLASTVLLEQALTSFKRHRTVLG